VGLGSRIEKTLTCVTACRKKVNKFVHCTSLLLESLKAFPVKLLEHEAVGVVSVAWIEDAMDETILHAGGLLSLEKQPSFMWKLALDWF
jgi:hypothetical protein